MIDLASRISTKVKGRERVHIRSARIDATQFPILHPRYTASIPADDVLFRCQELEKRGVFPRTSLEMVNGRTRRALAALVCGPGERARAGRTGHVYQNMAALPQLPLQTVATAATARFSAHSPSLLRTPSTKCTHYVYPTTRCMTPAACAL